jgi:raffinose/stachyose/melibiose transport system substrate-binding protein
MNRLFKTAAAAALCATSAFTAAPAMAQNVVEMKLFHRWPNDPFKSYIDGVIAEFQAANPGVKITTDQVLNDAYKDKIRIVIGSANVPDIFFSWSGEFAHNLARSGKAMDLTDILAQSPEWSDRIVQAQIEPFKMNGKVYGVPWQMDGKAIFYNKKIFAEHGVTEPKTFGELVAVCGKLQEAKVTPLLFGSRAAWAVSHYIGTFNERIVPPEVLKADYNRATGEFTHAGYVEALEKFAELSKCMNRRPNGIDHETTRNNFIAGRGAMAYLQYAEMGFLKAAQFDYGFFIFPEIKGGKGRQHTLQGAPQGWMISADTKHPQEAAKFLKFLISPEMGAKLTAATGIISPVKGAVNPQSATPQQLVAFEQIMNAGDPYIWLDTALDSSVADAYMRGVQLLLDGQKTPQEVMVDVQAAAKRVRENL